jgi:phosphatidate cytidylyltransferase
VLAVGLTGVALIDLRGHEEGRWLCFWFLAAVWATDVAAYFTGRAIGGPKLAPSISPGKTWAGLVGGVLAAGGWSFCWALWTDVAQPGTLAVLGMGTAVLAQLGDLGVSIVKRRFGAKDASNLIPGHGGLLDRADGFIGAAPIVALSIALAKGDMSLWASGVSRSSGRRGRSGATPST